MANAFERHGLDHLSASSINLFAAQPGAITPAWGRADASRDRLALPAAIHPI